MRVVVTGGAGFIGAALCRHLTLDLGWQVETIDKLTYAGHLSSLAAVLEHPKFGFVEADICDAIAVNGCLARHQPDAVLHLAAETHVDRSIDGANEFVRTNIVGTSVLLEAVRQYWEKLPEPRRSAFRFLNISTDEIYGSLGEEGRFDETSAVDPRSPYAASKASSDHLVSAWHHTYGLPALISNCSNNYGPYQLPEKLIPLVTLNAIDGKPLPVYGDGLNVRDWIFVDDHARALVAILTKGTPGQRYNVGARCERSNIAVVEAICDLVDRFSGARNRRALVHYVNDRPGHDRRYAIDPAKIERELGWQPQIDFDSGLERTVKWYIETSSWWQPLRAAGHGIARLGLAAGRTS